MSVFLFRKGCRDQGSCWQRVLHLSRRFTRTGFQLTLASSDFQTHRVLLTRQFRGSVMLLMVDRAVKRTLFVQLDLECSLEMPIIVITSADGPS